MRKATALAALAVALIPAHASAAPQGGCPKPSEVASEILRVAVAAREAVPEAGGDVTVQVGAVSFDGGSCVVSAIVDGQAVRMHLDGGSAEGWSVAEPSDADVREAALEATLASLPAALTMKTFDTLPLAKAPRSDGAWDVTARMVAVVEDADGVATALHKVRSVTMLPIGDGWTGLVNASEGESR